MALNLVTQAPDVHLCPSQARRFWFTEVLDACTARGVCHMQSREPFSPLPFLAIATTAVHVPFRQLGKAIRKKVILMFD